MGIGGGAALLVAGFVSQVTNERAIPPVAAPASTIVTQPARHTLPDGSVVELREGAEFLAAYTAATRRVVLRRGEAHFQVAKNAKPFVVVARELEVRAVGTAFSVHLDGKGIEVVVAHGQVAVGKGAADGVEWAAEDNRTETADRQRKQAEATPTAAPGSAASEWFVDAGNRLVVDTEKNFFAPQVFAVTEAELAQRLAWRVPRLEFNGTPLVNALATINRYSRVQLQLVGEEPGTVELSGVLRADNIEPLLAMLEGHYGLTLFRAGDIVIVSGAEPQTR
jgi:transmembrane sensor